VSGPSTVVDLPEAIEGLVTYFRSISGEHPDWDEYRQAMIGQGKVLIRVVPEQWGPISQGGFPARLLIEAETEAETEAEARSPEQGRGDTTRARTIR
jgi:hypothetical protein